MLSKRPSARYFDNTKAMILECHTQFVVALRCGLSGVARAIKKEANARDAVSLIVEVWLNGDAPRWGVLGVIR